MAEEKKKKKRAKFKNKKQHYICNKSDASHFKI